MPKKRPHIAFLFTNPKDELMSKVRARQDADTALHGFNHISGSDYFTVFPAPARSLWRIPILLRYDFVVTQDNLLLGYVVSICARILGLRTRWLYIAINSSTLMRRHENHPVRMFLFRKFWSSYSRIICLSSEQIEDFVRLGVPREHLVFVPYGVDTQFFRPTDVARGEDLIVSVGRDAGRDYATLFKAAERTGRSFVVVAGRKNIPPGMPVPANVSVLYDRPLAEVRELYARAKLVVVASKDSNVPDGSDCSGQTVILDALASGKAVIATDRAWIADYFIPGQDLIVVPPNDPGKLANAIEELSRDENRLSRLAESGHAKVAALYTTATFAEALLKLMDSIV